MADEAKPGDGASAAPHLPMVVSPKLDGSEEADAAPAFEASSHKSDEPKAQSAAAALLSRSLRFALLAASVASAAALGSFVGSLSAAGVMHVWPGAADGSTATAVNALPAGKTELAELSALKSGLDNATRVASGQFAKIADRLDRTERVQIESATKLAHVADSMDGLEKKVTAMAAATAAPATTGSIAGSAPPAPQGTADANFGDKVLPDWIVQDVRGGHALVENSRGAMFNVAAGGFLPGLGRVETVKRQDGQWIVVTARGLITQHN